jgi:hypothetical protein
MQPGRAEASPVNPEKLVSTSARTLQECSALAVLLVPDRDSCAQPDTSGTLSIAIRTGTRCAND